MHNGQGVASIAHARNGIVLILVALIAAASAGCNGWSFRWPQFKGAKPAKRQRVPRPVSLLLPKGIRIHPFTATRSFDERGSAGIDVRIEMLDHFGDSAKAFGDFRFELYKYTSGGAKTRANRINIWQVKLMNPKTNLVHWDSITRAYEFKLQLEKSIPAGQRLVLVAVFSSPFTERLFDEREFVAGK